MPLWKRGLDLVLIVLALPFLIPVLLLVALWIRVVSGGPVLFRQERIGLGGESFTIFKFRSMKASAGTKLHTDHVRELMRTDREMVKLDRLGDPRLIPGGCILRMSGLDELPQLLNVLTGDMSLVGPRPCLPEEFEVYKAKERARVAVHPGLTGYWQVKGKNTTRFSEMIEMDCHYASNRSLPLDFFIIMATPWALLKQVAESHDRPVSSTAPPQPGEESEQGVPSAHC